METLADLLAIIDTGGTVATLFIVTVLLYRRLDRQEMQEEELRDEFIEYLKSRKNSDISKAQ